LDRSRQGPTAGHKTSADIADFLVEGELAVRQYDEPMTLE
jgi:hypothetical protein